LHTWNAELIETLRPNLDLIDHLSLHTYWIRGGSELDFSVDEYYELLAESQRTENFITRTAQMLREEASTRNIGIAFDEWGVWHPEAREWGPGNVQRRTPNNYEQAGTLRDALAAGVFLEVLHRQCNVVSLANLAQLVNVLQAPVMTDSTRLWLTPTYYALALHKPHIGAQAVSVDIAQSDSLPDGMSAVSATASLDQGRTAVTLINRHYTEQVLVRFTGEGTQASGQLLSADQANAVNSAENPNRVQIVDLPVYPDGAGSWCVELPPHSMATVVIQ
jgi:alpha-N-arabinofuranosidase